VASKTIKKTKTKKPAAAKKKAAEQTMDQLVRRSGRMKSKGTSQTKQDQGDPLADE